MRQRTLLLPTVLIAAVAALVAAGAVLELQRQTAEGAAAFAWPNGAQGAVSLSYDDARSEHYRQVAPLLAEHGLRGTFYLSISSVDDPEPWKRLAEAGHELGNHSLFHSCRREPPERFGWLPEYYDLADYTAKRFRGELKVANLVLDLMDGGKPRTYGNTCTQVTIGRGDEERPMDPILDDLFVAARGRATFRPVDPRDEVQFTRLGHYIGDGRTFEELREEIEAAVEAGGWIIYMIHGVKRGRQAIDPDEHRKLVEWLDERRDTIWTAPVVEVAQYIKSRK